MSVDSVAHTTPGWCEIPLGRVADIRFSNDYVSTDMDFMRAMPDCRSREAELDRDSHLYVGFEVEGLAVEGL